MPTSLPETSLPQTGVSETGFRETGAEVDSAAVAGRLRLSATRLARRLRQEADTGLSPSQLSALAAIERHGPLTLGALADHEGVAPPTVSRVVARLEEQGLLLREGDPKDRRVARVGATAEGLALLAASRRRKTEWLAARLDALSPAERAHLAAALDVLDALTTEVRP
jgi:DNA-binding MarR family transcriptional regulator